MSRIKQVVSQTNTVVKKIVVGTPIKRVADTSSVSTSNAVHGQVLLYDSDQGKFVPSTLETGTDSAAVISIINQNTLDSADITNLVDATYINNLVDPNLFPEIATDSAAIKSVVDSDYINARVDAAVSTGVDSAAVTALIDSDYINARVNQVSSSGVDSAAVTALIDSAYVNARAAYSDSASIKALIDSNYINLYVDATGTVDSAYVITITDSAVGALRINVDSDIQALDARIDNLFIEAIDSALVSKVVTAEVDSAYISGKFNVLNDFLYERIYDSNLDSVGNVQLTIDRDIIPRGVSEPSLGSRNRPFKDLYLSGQSIFMGDTKISEDPVTGAVTFEKVDADGNVDTTQKTTFSFNDSDIQAVQTLTYFQDSNKIVLSAANAEDFVVRLDRMNELELLGDLKGPPEFNIAPFPHDNVSGGQVNIVGRLNVQGDLFKADVDTIDFTRANLIQLGTGLDSAIDGNGGGFTVGGANAYLRYNFNTDRFVTNKGIAANNFQGKYLGFDSDLINTNTDGLPEGSNNLYYTQTRVDNRVQQVVDETYIRSRQLTTQIDSDVIARIVVNYVDSSYTGTVQTLLNQLDSSQSIVRGIVDSDYITSKFQAVNGKVTSVTIEPSINEFVFQPTGAGVTYVQDSDVNGKILRFDNDNVTVYLNGARLVEPFDFTVNSDGTRVTFPENVGPGNTIAVVSAREEKINFSSSLVDSDQTIAGDSASRFDFFPKNSYRYAKYLITANVTTGGIAKYQASEVLVAHNDIDASYTEYGIVQTQDSNLGDIIVEIVGSNVKVSFDPIYENTNVKFSRLVL